MKLFLVVTDAQLLSTSLFSLSKSKMKTNERFTGFCRTRSEC